MIKNITNYELEEVADWAIEEGKSFIDTEEQFITKAHGLYSALLGWHNIIGHLLERIPTEELHLHELIENISEKIHELTELVNRGRLSEMQFLEQEQEIQSELKGDIQNKTWSAVKTDLQKETEKENELIELEKHELDELHRLFSELIDLIKKSKIKSALEEDKIKDKKTCDNIEEYYFAHIYHSARTYQRVLKHLLKVASRKAEDLSDKT